jgi:hypothetical protein
VSVADICGVIDEVAQPAEVVRIMLEVPPAPVGELVVVIKPETLADLGKWSRPPAPPLTV